ncbi:unnamed protein product, partial [Meganyctiphanes norvegica]
MDSSPGKPIEESNTILKDDCIQEVNHDICSRKRKLCESPENPQETKTSENNFKTPKKDYSIIDNQKLIRETQSIIKEKEEIIRKLKLVRTYRNKPETQNLDTITEKWLAVCQEALEDLKVKIKNTVNNETQDQEFSLKMLIEKLGICPQLLKLNE